MIVRYSLFHKLDYLLKTIIYLFFATVFFTNNPTLAWLADEIRDEIVIPIKQSYFLELSDNGYEPSSLVTPSYSPTPGDSKSTTIPSPTVAPVNLSGNKIIIGYTTLAPARTVNEGELWDALTTYRRTHGRKDIDRSESLCQYARRRVGELYQRYTDNPDDPLDNHAGFQRDADSGYLFETTGFSHVGENLAFTPGYATATQIIEWAWDTSSGHRSLQLSEDMTNGCLSGKHPLYVGIYGY